MSQRPRTAEHRAPPRTRVALLGTLGPLHVHGLRYDIDRLRSLVETIEPDLLGIEAASDAWGSDDATRLPSEIRDGLAEGARLTDTVVVPLGEPSPLELAPPVEGELARSRAAFMRAADRLLAAVGRAIDDPAGVSRGAYVRLCRAVCHLEAAAAGEPGRGAWARTNEKIVDALLQAVRRDPGRRVLVAVECRRIHVLEARLRALPDEIELVRFEDLAPLDALPGAGPAASRDGRLTQRWRRAQ